MPDEQTVKVIMTHFGAPTFDDFEALLSTEYNFEKHDVRGVGGGIGEWAWLPTGLCLFLSGPVFWTSKKIFEKLGDELYEKVKDLLLRSHQTSGTGEMTLSPRSILVRVPESRMGFCFYLPPYATSSGERIEITEKYTELQNNALEAIPEYYKKYNSHYASPIESTIADEICTVALHFYPDIGEWKIRSIHSSDY